MRAGKVGNCCSLREISGLGGLAREDSWGKQDKTLFKHLLTERSGTLYNCKATIVVISDEDEGRKEQAAFLEKQGMKLLGTYQADWDICPHTVYLYGSKEFRLPRRQK